jgi:hypothetical protein
MAEPSRWLYRRHTVSTTLSEPEMQQLARLREHYHLSTAEVLRLLILRAFRRLPRRP